MRAVAALFLAFASAFAVAAPAPSDEPPARVGRVSWISGEVAVYTDPEQGWEKGYVNSPLTSENSLWTEPGARAELRIGPTTLRLDETTQVDIRRLDDDELRAHVVRGRVTIRIREFDRGERYLISTPQARFAITAAGRYRLDAEETGESVLTVFTGSAEVEAGRRATIAPGDAVRVREDGEQFEFERISNTAFDTWAAQRDERVDRLVSETVRYVSPQMTGYEDLAEHGRWSTEPDYGAVWYPISVGADYVPYRNGHWVHTRPWGWTWVDYAPWGYAPFHYGRWVQVGNRWGWCPGRYVARPVWAPALVGWVGSPGFSVAISGGRAPAMGWYPLSPWDNYRPWYTNNTRYINSVNVIVNVAPRGRDYERDRNRERGSTVVLREDFVRQRPVAQGLSRVSGEAAREAVRGAQVATNPAQILPPRQEVQRPRGNVPAQVGGQVVGPRPAPSVSQPGVPAAPRVANPAAPQFAPGAAQQGAPRVVTPGQQYVPAAPRVATPVPQQPAPQAAQPAPRPSYGGEPVRAPRGESPTPGQLQQQQQQQSAPAPRGRPPQPAELREERQRPAPQPQLQQVAPAAPRVQPQPQTQPLQAAPAAPRAQPQREEKPDKSEKPEKPDKPDKPEKPGQRER